MKLEAMAPVRVEIVPTLISVGVTPGAVDPPDPPVDDDGEDVDEVPEVEVVVVEPVDDELEQLAIRSAAAVNRTPITAMGRTVEPLVRCFMLPQFLCIVPLSGAILPPGKPPYVMAQKVPQPMPARFV